MLASSTDYVCSCVAFLLVDRIINKLWALLVDVILSHNYNFFTIANCIWTPCICVCTCNDSEIYFELTSSIVTV